MLCFAFPPLILIFGVQESARSKRKKAEEEPEVLIEQDDEIPVGVGLAQEDKIYFLPLKEEQDPSMGTSFCTASWPVPYTTLCDRCYHRSPDVPSMALLS